MITSLSWLKNHLDTKANFNQLAERLTEIGLEVENIKSSNANLDNFIVCKIVKSQKHPNADQLKLCEVNIGSGNLVKVVCGAQNARDGLFAVYAPPGATIPKTNMKLKVAKIRGIESHGMLCSGYELDESSDKEGIIELDKKEKNIGEKYFKNIGEKTMDIAITPNRPDCLGVRGIARDLASSGLGKLKKQSLIKINQKFKNPIKVSIKKEKGQGCGIFGSVYIKNVQNKESPDWLKKRIISLGLKPVSAIVDTTNYIMFDLNRPLHAYDADKINQEIIVRNSTKGESFEALDNKKYTLQNNMCAISDKSGVLGLGGIIGGTRSGTEFSTKNILLESAYFFPSPIRKTSKILNIDTDAKYRFERGIDPDSIKLGLELGMCMILDMCGGEASKFSIVGKIKDERKTIDLEVEKFSKVIGFSITGTEIKKILSSLGCSLRMSGKKMKVLPPTWRPDIKEDIDLIEELARLYGYDKVPVQRLSVDANISQTSQSKIDSYDISQALVNRGYQEVITYSFISNEYHDLIDPSAKKITLKNPISDDMSIMRSSLWPGLLQTVEMNQRRGHHNARFFEVGLCFSGISVDDQRQKIAGIICGERFKSQWGSPEREVDFFDAKSDVESLLGLSSNDYLFEAAEHPALQAGQAAKISRNSQLIGWIGALSPHLQKKLSLPKLFLFELNQSDIEQRKVSSYESFSSFQASQRDIALVVAKNVNADQLIYAIRSLNQEHLIEVNLFDVYEGEHIEKGKKSVALNLTYQSIEATLTDDQLNQQVEDIVTHLESKFSAKLR